MAYLRKEKETVEMDFPLNKVWETIPRTVASLKWTIESSDEATHKMQVKTKSAFLSYASMLSIEAKSVAENVSRVTVSAETPVTTITSVLDFGQTEQRVELFLQALSIRLNSGTAKPKEEG